MQRIRSGKAMHHIGRGGEKSAIERDGGGGGIAEKRRRRRNSRGFVAGRKGEGANPSSLSGSLPALALLRPQPQSGQSRTTHPASLVCSLLRPPDFCAYMCGIFCTEVRGVACAAHFDVSLFLSRDEGKATRDMDTLKKGE